MVVEKTIRINDIKISYNLKPAQNPALNVLYIHGFPFNKSIWDNQLTGLPGNMQGVAYDVRGHGKSTSGHGYFSIDLFAQDLNQLIIRLKLENVILCGISMGGYISLRALELSSSHIAGLVLVDTHSFADSNETKSARFASIETIVGKGKEFYAESFITKLFSAQTFKKQSPSIGLVQKSILENTLNNICSTLLALASRTDTTGFLKNITVPTLIIRGAEDQIISHQLALDLHQNIKHSIYKEIMECGHLPNLENSTQFNSLLTQFLLNISARA